MSLTIATFPPQRGRIKPRTPE